MSEPTAEEQRQLAADEQQQLAAYDRAITKCTSTASAYRELAVDLKRAAERAQLLTATKFIDPEDGDPNQPSVTRSTTPELTEQIAYLDRVVIQLLGHAGAWEVQARTLREQSKES